MLFTEEMQSGQALQADLQLLGPADIYCKGQQYPWHLMTSSMTVVESPGLFLWLGGQALIF